MNPMKRTIAAFDFDGTITTRDSMLELIRYIHGSWQLRKWLVLNFHRLLLMKAGFLPSGEVKQRLLSHFFGGILVSDFEKRCDDFFNATHTKMLRDAALRRVDYHRANGDTIVIVSASADIWIKPFARHLGICDIISSQMEVTPDGRLTGKILGHNCKGKEKVARFLERFPDRSDYRVEAYGDSSGDKEMLIFADIPHLKNFGN